VELLRDLTSIPGPSGSEYAIKQFVLDYVRQHSDKWLQRPLILHDESIFHDNIVLVFGRPTTAIFAHLDTVGYTARYENQLVEIGSPAAAEGTVLVGQDAFGPIECKLIVDDEGNTFHDFARPIQRGTTLTYKPNYRIDNEFVQSPYLDNRLGVYSALKVAEKLENGIIIFSTYEEHGGGSVPFLLNFLQTNYPIRQALISDITWVTDGVRHGQGVALSIRDRNIPRRTFLEKILLLADDSGIKYQTEVEQSGSSDGREVQMSPYMIDWMFVGAPEDHVHSPDERVSIEDIQSMVDMYTYLMSKL
jgi:putative aminopeptidase FrvX